MSNHIIKYEYDDGVKLEKPILWCGGNDPASKWLFVDAQHAALAVGGSIRPCQKCIMEIIRTLEKEID